MLPLIIDKPSTPFIYFPIRSEHVMRSIRVFVGTEYRIFRQIYSIESHVCHE